MRARRLLLIDGLNVVRRIWEAIPVEDSPEKAVGATRSCLSSFSRALKEYEPSHVLAAFDHGGPTWRHRRFASYHEGRDPMPTSMRDALPALLEQIRALGIHTISVPDVEADDVIAAVARRWLGSGEAIVLSTDKDLAALIADGVRVRNHFKDEERDSAWTLKRFGVQPSQLHDLLALCGDASDGIRGVPGVGVKTAAKLLTAFGSLDAVLQAARAEPPVTGGLMTGKVRESLLAHEQAVRLARELVGFKTDMKMGLTWNAIRFEPTSAAPAWEPSPSV